MSSRGPYRRHAAQFKLQLCQAIRSDSIGRRDAQTQYSLSANLIQLWLTQFDRGELTAERSRHRWSTTARPRSRLSSARSVSSRWSSISSIETSSLRLVSNSEKCSIISAPKAAPSEGDAK